MRFRTEPLDLDAFKIAKGSLGKNEPENHGAWAYFFTRMQGKIWHHGVVGKGAEGRIAVNKSLGCVFSKGCLADNSSETVVGRIRPHLDAILPSTLKETLPYKDTAQGFLRELAKLPLWVAHCDLNGLNVLIDEKLAVTALIDWELSFPLPFGVGFGRIHILAGEYSGGKFSMPDEFEVAERGFWKELFDGMPGDTREMLEKCINVSSLKTGRWSAAKLS